MAGTPANWPLLSRLGIQAWTFGVVDFAGPATYSDAIGDIEYHSWPPGTSAASAQREVAVVAAMTVSEDLRLQARVQRRRAGGFPTALLTKACAASVEMTVLWSQIGEQAKTFLSSY